MNNNALIQIPDIHIGNEISTYLKDKGVPKSRLAREIGMNAANLGKLLKKKSFETYCKNCRKTKKCYYQ